jgi:hypothetical protein
MSLALHPHINRSISIIKNWFGIVFGDQKPLLHDKCRQIIYKILQARSSKL